MRECTVLEAWEVECDSAKASDHTEGPAVIQAAAHTRSHDERRTWLCTKRGLDKQKASIWGFLFVEPPILSTPPSPPQPQLQNVVGEEHSGSEGAGSGSSHSSLFLIVTTFAKTSLPEQESDRLFIDTAGLLIVHLPSQSCTSLTTLVNRPGLRRRRPGAYEPLH